MHRLTPPEKPPKFTPAQHTSIYTLLKCSNNNPVIHPTRTTTSTVHICYHHVHNISNTLPTHLKSTMLHRPLIHTQNQPQQNPMILWGQFHEAPLARFALHYYGHRCCRDTNYPKLWATYETFFRIMKTCPCVFSICYYNVTV